jgi:hypothetical protein
MKREAIDTRNGKPRPDSVNLGRWLRLLRLYGVGTPVAELENSEAPSARAQAKTIDDILAELAREQELRS